MIKVEDVPEEGLLEVVTGLSEGIMRVMLIKTNEYGRIKRAIATYYEVGDNNSLEVTTINGATYLLILRTVDGIGVYTKEQYIKLRSL